MVSELEYLHEIGRLTLCPAKGTRYPEADSWTHLCVQLYTHRRRGGALNEKWTRNTLTRMHGHPQARLNGLAKLISL